MRWIVVYLVLALLAAGSLGLIVLRLVRQAKLLIRELSVLGVQVLRASEMVTQVEVPTPSNHLGDPDPDHRGRTTQNRFET